MTKKKIFLIMLLFIILFIFLISNSVSATWVKGLGNLDEYNAEGVSASPNFNEKVNNVINIIRIVASIISVIVLVALGIKYMFGSVEEKAQYKETMKPYLIGAILVFGITNVTSILYSIMKGMF